MKKEFATRKQIRWDGYDYSHAGTYFITICTEQRKNLLSTVVGEGLAPPEIHLTDIGEIVEQQLLSLEARYPNLTNDCYVIMPNHIHVIFLLNDKAGGASPSPTVSDIICSFKSLASRLCKQRFGIEKLFQRSYYDHVIRDSRDYDEHVRYIGENPMFWLQDELYQ